jgi:UDP-N-acetylmuramoyl-L-alanyl-D-glutamate--2,6-diaminopimelate ligase
MNLSGMEVSSLSLRETLGPVSFVSAGDVVASSFCCDSRNLRPGEVFVAVPGKSHDGHGFIEAAVSAGASAVMVERPHARINIPQCVVPDVRAAFAKICLAQHGNPQRNVTVAGVTGTNGKTTSTWLLRAILESAGRTTGLLGTIEYSNGRARSAAALTTPDPPQIAHLFADMAKQRASHCVMEISSHALDQRRCAALPLAVAAITNITRDHFDYHGDVRNYRTAKSRIADLLQPGAPLLIGVDDPGCRAVLDLLPSSTNVTTFGFTETAQTRVELTSATPRSQTLRMHLKSGTVEFISSLVGRHNALNLLTAAAMAEQLGMDLPIIADSLSAVTEIPGRMERIDLGQPFTILVDYAHTPDGITHCLATARALTPGRVILVFGAGGDRDREKRPLMAQAASPADSIIVTSDNPRSESPTKIIDEICQGFASLDHVQTCVDRNLAIQMAAKMAQPGDVVIIAGRGHESIQQIGTRSISFDDRKVTRRILRELQASRSDSEHRVPNAVPA